MGEGGGKQVEVNGGGGKEAGMVYLGDVDVVVLVPRKQWT